MKNIIVFINMLYWNEYINRLFEGFNKNMAIISLKNG